MVDKCIKYINVPVVYLNHAFISFLAVPASLHICILKNSLVCLVEIKIVCAFSEISALFRGKLLAVPTNMFKSQFETFSRF